MDTENMKTSNILIAGILCVATSGCSFLDYTHVRYKTDPELAMYKGSPHGEMEKLYKAYIEETIEKYGSRERASAIAAQDGWTHISTPLPEDKYILNADVDLAMRSFNGAWLLWENNYEAYWGFGVCASIRGYPDEARKYFDGAVGLNPNNANLLLNAAQNYTILGAKGDVQTLDKAIALYNKALNLAPDDSVKKDAYSNWAFTLYYKGDYASAWDKVKLAEQAGWKCPEHDFLEALSKQMPRPK